MAADNSAAQGRRLSAPLSEKAAARRAAFETVSGEREWRDSTAREVLDKRSADKGWDGLWPCHFGQCVTDGLRDNPLWQPADLTLIHVSRAFELYRTGLKPVLDKSIPEEYARNTDRAPVCRHCQEFMRDRVRFDDGPEWEELDNAR